MEVTLSADLNKQVEQELASGRYRPTMNSLNKLSGTFLTIGVVATGGSMRSAESAWRSMKPACMSECRFPIRNDGYSARQSRRLRRT